MAAGFRLSMAALGAVLLAHAALAQDAPTPELTPAGKAMVARIVAAKSKSPAPPVAVCAFHGGPCGAFNSDGSMAVPPRYDWIGAFSGGRAAVGVGGFYGYIDEQGREVVKAQYRRVHDYKFGFAQIEVNDKSGLIDRDGKMVFEPKYGFIEAIAPDRFRVSEKRLSGVAPGFAREYFPFDPKTPVSDGRTISGVFYPDDGMGSGVIDRAGRWIEPPGRVFDQDDPSLRLVKQDQQWGLQRADGSWVFEPRYQQVGVVSSGLAPVALSGRWGFIDHTGKLVIEPVPGLACQPKMPPPTGTFPCYVEPEASQLALREFRGSGKGLY